MAVITFRDGTRLLTCNGSEPGALMSTCEAHFEGGGTREEFAAAAQRAGWTITKPGQPLMAFCPQHKQAAAGATYPRTAPGTEAQLARGGEAEHYAFGMTECGCIWTLDELDKLHEKATEYAPEPYES